MFNKNHTKLANVLGGAVSTNDFTLESLQFLRDVKKQYDKTNKEERKRLRKYAQRIYEYGEPLEFQRLKEYDEKVLNDSELFRPGALNDYNMWLLDYLKQGGKITHYYDYSFNPSAWFVVNNTQKRVFLKNPQSLCFIIPKGCSFEDLYEQYDCGQDTHVYGWENGEAVVSGSHFTWVPVYADTIDKQILEIAHRVLGAPRY